LGLNKGGIVWTKPQQLQEVPGASVESTPSSTTRQTISTARPSALIGPSLKIKGQITGNEDLRIDGKVEGPISLLDHELTVGFSAELNSEIASAKVIVYGKVVGNVQARHRVDIKTDGSVIGDISTARISIEDGAHFKGRIEIDPAKSATNAV